MNMRPLLPDQPVTAKGDRPSLELVEIIQRLIREIEAGGGGGGTYTDADARAAVVIDSIANGDVDHAPSRNVVFDALAGKASAAQGALADSALQPGDALPWGDLTGVPATFPPSAHTHAIADVTGLQAELDALQGATGSGVLAFGAAPGGNVATLTVTGQTGIVSGSAIRAWLQGSTADHNAYEHLLILPGSIGLGIGDVVNGVGFTIYAQTELRLTGSVAVKWEWR
jgi:hypothetical protein